VGVALGSCIQIALFVAPVLVLLGGVIGPQPFALSFSRGDMGFLFVSVLLGGLVATGHRRVQGPPGPTASALGSRAAGAP